MRHAGCSLLQAVMRYPSKTCKDRAVGSLLAARVWRDSKCAPHSVHTAAPLSAKSKLTRLQRTGVTHEGDSGEGPPKVWLGDGVSNIPPKVWGDLPPSPP